MPRLWIVVCCLAMIACDKKTPPVPQPPVVGSPTIEVINGSERVGWDQPAADSVELATIGYAIYVDGGRAQLAGVTCASTAAEAGFPCTARMPTMSSGAHTLELAAFVNDGGVLESARSAPLRVTLVAQTAPAVNTPSIRHGLAGRAQAFADGLESPTDLAFAPDGRIFVAERAGTIRVIRPLSPSASAGPARPLAEPAITLADTLGAGGQLLALALDPQFERSHYVFAIYTAPSRPGEPSFALARFREVNDTLGDRAVLLAGVPASTPSPSAALRFGPDGKLYAAFDDGGDARRRRDGASLNGKVLRLNPDGTTPGDARGATPVLADGYGSPIAVDWDPPTGTLWVADRAAGALAFTFYRSPLFPAWSGRMVSADGGPVAIGPDGAIYGLTARGIDRLAPDRGS